MNFVVTYREKDGSRSKIAIEAADRAGVFPILRERGISAIRVEEGKLSAKDGRSKCPTSNRIKLLLAGCTLLTLVAVALTFVFDRPNDTKTSKTTTEGSELPPSIEKASSVCEKLQSNSPLDRTADGACSENRSGIIRRIRRGRKTIPTKSLRKNQKWLDIKSGITWQYDEFSQKGSTGVVAVITGAYACRGTLTIPKIVDGRRVERVGNSAFSERNDLSLIEIPDGVREIEWGAFADCVNVKSISFPDTLEKIEGSAFAGCTSLLHVQLPQGVAVVYGGFGSCTNLLSITVSQGMKDLNFEAFVGCEKLETIHVARGEAAHVIGLLKGSWRKFEVKGDFLVAVPSENKPVRHNGMYGDGEFMWRDPGTGFWWCFDEYTQEGTTNVVVRLMRLVDRGVRHVSIPARIGGKPVESIERNALGGCLMPTVVIPASVRHIRGDAFVGSLRLSSILVEANNPWLKVVDGVLYDREMKTLVAIPPARKGPYVMPSSVTNDVSLALWHVEGRSDVKVSQDNSHYKSVDGVLFTKDGRCLVSCPKSRSGTYEVPEGVTSICHHAFSHCERLSAVSLPKSLLRIGDFAFDRCTNLSSGVIFQGVEVIGEYAFESCSSSKISIPGSVKKIGCGAFNACPRMSTLEICEGIKEIDRDAFAQCKALESVLIPASVTNVQSRSFGGCYALGRIETVSQNRFYSSKNGVLYDKAFKSLIICPPAKRALYIPMGVSSVADNACLGNLCEIFIPSSVSSIGRRGRRAFSHSSGERTVHVCSNDVERIRHLISEAGHNTMGMRFVEDYSSADEDKVMSMQKPLTSSRVFKSLDYKSEKVDGVAWHYYISNGVTVVEHPIIGGRLRGPAVAKEVSGSVTVPNKLGGLPVCGIGRQAFGGLKVTKVTVPPTVTNIDSEAFDGCKSLSEVLLPCGVSSIGDRAFYYCTNLVSVTVPAGLTHVGGEAFAGCRRLAGFTIPTNCVSIGARAFEGCDALGKMKIPAGVRRIGDGAFPGLQSFVVDEQNQTFRHVDGGSYDKTGTRMLGFPSTGIVARISAAVTNISESACKDLGSAKSIEVDPENRFYKSIGGCLYDKNGTVLLRCARSMSQLAIPNGVKRIGPHAFEANAELVEVSFPTSVVEIGECAFYACRGLSSVSLPANVTNISGCAFSYCTSLESVTIPSSVKHVGNHAFNRCKNLKSVVLKPGVESVGSQAFISCPKLSVVHLPSSVRRFGRMGAYKTFDVWGHYTLGPNAPRRSKEDGALTFVVEKGDEERVRNLLYDRSYERQCRAARDRGLLYPEIKVVTEEEWQGGKSPVKADKDK